MSMISAQCDELRAMAESIGLEVPQAATLMMEAADTIDRLGAESARMRQLAKPVIVSDSETDCATGYCRCGACGQGIDQWDHFCRWCGAGVDR